MIGTTFAGRYQVFDSLGEGATGEVWKANDLNQKQVVALKTFKPGASTIHVYGEASVLTALEGRHVLRVFNADTADDISYIATKVAAVGTTENVINNNKRGVPPATALTWLRQALVGLGACHDRGLLHRDIKPANVFLETYDYALLGDFGMAVELDADGTAPGDGTTHTIAPEMLDGGRGTVRSDVYSMGVTGYRLLTGRWPFDGATQAEVWAAARSGIFDRVREVAPHVGRRFAERIERAMALDPSNRFESWREMHEELGRHGLVGNNWRRRVTADSGHSRCWIEVRDVGARRVCMIAGTKPNTFDIDVRHATGAEHRITAACRYGVGSGRVGVALREVFDSL